MADSDALPQMPEPTLQWEIEQHLSGALEKSYRYQLDYNEITSLRDYLTAVLEHHEENVERGLRPA